MISKSWMALALALVANPGAAQAPPASIADITPGITYFNRPGADRTSLTADLDDCRETIKTLDFGDDVVAGGIIGAMVNGHANAVNTSASYENCMVVKGWRVVRLSSPEDQTIAGQSQADIIQSVEPWIGSETPHGDVVRVWGNDAARASVLRDSTLPVHMLSKQLGLSFLTPYKPIPEDELSAAKALKKLEDKYRRPAKLDARWPKRPLKPTELTSVPPESAIVIVRVKGVSMRYGNGVLFARMPASGDAPPSYVDRAPDILDAGVGAIFGKPDGNWMIFAAPPGRWRLSAMGLLYYVTLCLGGPAFEAKAGEVIYAGTFDLSSETFGPDLDLAAPKSYLSGQPAASSVHAASYVNGARGRCDNPFYNSRFLYALEIPGAPFEPGYAWGGAHANGRP